MQYREALDKERAGEEEMDVRIDEFFDSYGEIAFLCELAGQLSDLGFGGDLARHEQPEHTLGYDLFASWCRRQLLLTVGDAQTMESNALYHGNVRTLFVMNGFE